MMDRRSFTAGRTRHAAGLRAQHGKAVVSGKTDAAGEIGTGAEQQRPA